MPAAIEDYGLIAEDDATIEAGDVLIMLSRHEHHGGLDAFGIA
jgi:hypothetical protein